MLGSFVGDKNKIQLQHQQNYALPPKNCFRNDRNKNYLRLGEALKTRAGPEASPIGTESCFCIIIAFPLNTNTFSCRYR